MNFFTIIKFLGIISAAYFSYIGFTRKTKDENGNLTKDGQLSKYGIIISCIISILCFYGDYLKGQKQGEENKDRERLADKSYNNSTYPIDNLQLEVTYESNTTSFTNQYPGILDSINILADAIQKNPYYDASLPKTLKVRTENPNIPDYEFKLDSNGKVEYAFLDSFKNRHGIALEHIANLSYTLISNFGFIQEIPDSLYSMDLRNLNYDIAFSKTTHSFARKVYRLPTKSIEQKVTFPLTLIKNNGKISNLIELTNSTCVIPIGRPNYISIILRTEKGYTLTTSKMDKINKHYSNDQFGLGTNYMIGKFTIH